MPYVLAAVCVAFVAAVPAFADPSVSAKQAQAQAVMGQLQTLSDQLEQARSQYDASTAQLARIQGSLRENQRELQVAQHNLKQGERVIAQRLVTLYTTDQTSTLEVILGAKSLDDMLNRISSAKSVTNLDSKVLAQVKSFRVAIKRNGALLAQERATQRQVVARRAAAKQQIAQKIGQANTLLSSIKGQIASMIAAQHARQLQMAREAQQRLAAQQQAAAVQQQDTVVGVSAAAPDASTVVAPPSTHGGVVGIAEGELGVPYVWGGASPSGFDCSGLVMWAYAQMGVALPHSTYAQYAMGVPVSKDELEPGDLVFFDGVGHVGIYIGGGQFIEAPHTGGVVQISDLNVGWYAATYVGARRIL